MDLMLIVIIVALVGIGAFFFGFPIGFVVGRRQKQRQFERDYFIYPSPECVQQSGERLEKSDVLNAEIIEYRRSGNDA